MGFAAGKILVLVVVIEAGGGRVGVVLGEAALSLVLLVHFRTMHWQVHSWVLAQ